MIEPTKTSQKSWNLAGKLKSSRQLFHSSPETAYSLIVSEQLKYEVVKRLDGFEVRKYAGYALAQVQIRGDFLTAGNSAFSTLLRYITGLNQSKQQMAMVAPVFQTSVEPDHHLVSFTLPASVSGSNAPVPIDEMVKVVDVEPHVAVASRFSGLWNYDRFLTASENLEDAVESAISNGDISGRIVGEPFFARYNSPFTPFFLRRNEVIFAFEEK